MFNRPALFFVLTLVAFASTGFGWVNDQFATREPRYHLHPGDVLHVSYRYTPEYDTTVTVQPDGYATLPLLGEAKLGGLTLNEIHSQLVQKGSERLNDPEISLDLRSFEQPYYIVGGQVVRPGRFEIHGRITALRAVELAGGFAASGKETQILLIHPVNNVDGQTKLIDLKKVLNKHQLSEDPEIQAGDLLIVPKTRLAQIEPYVRLANAGFYLNPLSLGR